MKPGGKYEPFIECKICKSTPYGEDMFLQIAKTSSNGDVIGLALKRLGGDLLRDVRENAASKTAKDYALNNLIAQGFLTQEELIDIAKNNESLHFRESAARKITDETLGNELLKEIRGQKFRAQEAALYKEKYFCKNCNQFSCKESGSDYYSGSTDFKCTICGKTHSVYTSMGHG
jgi:hypothetical protein